MKSRLLVGVGAWLLGAAAATSGSMIAVNQLAHGLLGPQTQQLTEANLSVNPDAETDRAAPSATASRASDQSGKRPAVRAAKSPAATQSSSQGLAGTLLQSPDGSVMAVCQAAGAYLLYWSPDQGFEADDVIQGPAPVARVIFRGRTSSVGVRVSCVAGSPVAHLYRPPPDDGKDGPYDT